MSHVWQGLQSAPHDRKVWVFLPSANFETGADGRPTAVKNEVVPARWSAERTAWLTDDGRTVYPSLWSDADVAGAAPPEPVLG